MELTRIGSLGESREVSAPWWATMNQRFPSALVVLNTVGHAASATALISSGAGAAEELVHRRRGCGVAGIG